MRRRSISPVLWARVGYQLYLATAAPAFALLAAAFAYFGAIFVVTWCTAAANALVQALMPEEIARGFATTLLIAGWHISPFSFLGVAWDGFILIPALLLGLPLLFLLLRGLAEDRLIPLVLLSGLTLGGAGLVVIEMQNSSPNFAAMDAGDRSDVLSKVMLLTLPLPVIFHLIAALLVRASSFARAMVAAPRVGIVELSQKYFRRDGGPARRAAVLAAKAAGWTVIRTGLAVIAVILATSGLVLFTPDNLILLPDGRDVTPLLGVMIIFSGAALVLAWDIVSRPGIRLYNLAVLLGFAQSALLLAAVVFADNDSLEIPDLRVAAQGSVLPFLVMVRGFIFGPARRAAGEIRRTLVRTASEVTAEARHAPILLLRSFEDDAAFAPTTFRSVAFAFGGAARQTPIEEIVAQALFARGPVIAVADPREGSPPPPLGAVRDALPHDDWQNYILRRIDEAQLIVCIVGSSPSFGWEIEQIIARDAVTKTLFVAPRDYPGRRTLASMGAGLVARLGAEADERRYRRARVFAHNARRGGWDAVTSLWGNERSYTEAVRVGAALALSRAEPACTAGH